MTLAAIHKRVEESFFRWGWLLPVVLPLTELGGRGFYNTLAGLYGIWGLLSFWGRRQQLDRTTALLYLLVLAVFLLGIPGAIDPKEGLRIWLGSVSYTHLDVYKRQLLYRPSPRYTRDLCRLDAGVIAVGQAGILRADRVGSAQSRHAGDRLRARWGR